MKLPASGAHQPWHNLTVDEICSLLATTPAGLTQTEAAKRLAQYGRNELQAAQKVSPWAVFLQQFKNVLIVILLVAALFSAFLGHAVEAVTISVIVLFAALLGFIQEYRAERAIDALRQLAAPEASLLRDGEETKVPAGDLVPGDVVLLRAGDRVPADLRLVEAVNLQIEESALTGESVAVEKSAAPLHDPQIALGERSNMAYAGPPPATAGEGESWSPPACRRSSVPSPACFPA